MTQTQMKNNKQKESIPIFGGHLFGSIFSVKLLIQLVNTIFVYVASFDIKLQQNWQYACNVSNGKSQRKRSKITDLSSRFWFNDKQSIQSDNAKYHFLVESGLYFVKQSNSSINLQYVWIFFY